MPGDQPYAGHDGTAVLLLILLGLGATTWLTVRGIRLLVRARGAGPAVAATLAGAAAVGAYTWGLLHLFFFDDVDQAQACRTALGGRQLTGYAPSFVPLRFGCRTGDGHTVEAVIPSYVNPAVAVLGVCAVALTLVARATAGRVSSRRTRCGSLPGRWRRRCS